MSAAPELGHLRVVLVAARNPLNIGAAARAMSNFGFLSLRVVNPYDVAFREARSAVGAAELLANAEEYKDLAEAVADCSLVVGTTAASNREVQHQMKLLPDGAALIRNQLRAGNAALVFGSEKRGLSNDDLSHCHWLLSIPTRAGHRSMNLGQAVAVCLYELIRNDAADAGASADYSNAASLERLTVGLLDVLRMSGYMNDAAAVSAEQKVRRLVRRLCIRNGDDQLLLGMLRQILWKLESSGKPSEPAR